MESCFLDPNKQMVEVIGFKETFYGSPPDKKTMGELGLLKIHPSFRQFTNEDLAVLTSYLVAVNMG